MVENYTELTISEQEEIEKLKGKDVRGPTKSGLMMRHCAPCNNPDAIYKWNGLYERSLTHRFPMFLCIKCGHVY